jgi:hypothetical protein
MGFFLNFYFDKIFIYFFIRALSFLLRRIIRIYYSELFINQIFSLFIMFLGESLSFFLWIILKFKSKGRGRVKTIVFQKKNSGKKSCLKRFLKKIYIPFLIFFCSFCDFCGSFNYYEYYSYSILKFSDNFDNLNKIFLCLFVTYNEIYILNIQTYIHNIIGLIIIIISLIVVIIYSLIRNVNQLDFLSFLLFFIITLEYQYIESILYTIEKKLNFEYFISIYKLCFYEGIFGIILTIIYRFFSVFIFKNDNSFLIHIDNKEGTFKTILILFLYCILTLIYNICRLKISEKNRPSYNIISEVLWVFFSTVSDSILKKKSWDFGLILYYFFSLLGSCIFCEVISLNFCGLNKNIFSVTAKRATMEIYCLNENNDSSNEDSSNGNIF